MDDASSRPAEQEVMALLERMIATVEQAQTCIQDDGLITGRKDLDVLSDAMMRVRALSLEMDALLRLVR